MTNNNLYDWKPGEAINLVGNFRIYPFTMLIGIIASIFSILYFWRKNKFPIDTLLILIIFTIPSAIIGARLFWIIETAINHESLARWWAIWDGGLSIQGGVFVPIVVDLLYLRRKRNIVDIRKAFGIILPNVLLGQAIGRWGNFANHELYGNVCNYDSIAWLGKGISWNMYIDGEFRVPLFLIESWLSLIGYFVLVWWLLQFGKVRPGTTGGLYLLWYGVTRVILEPFRNSNDFEYWYLILAILFIVAGIVLTFYFEKTGKKVYQKIKISNYSYFYHNQKTIITPINNASKWINA